MITYELWVDEEGTYTLFEKNAKMAKELLGKNNKLIISIEAQSWEEAQEKKHEFLGWEKYKPM